MERYSFQPDQDCLKQDSKGDWVRYADAVKRITDLERRVKALEDYVQLSADVPTTEIYAMAAFRKAMLNSGR